MPVNFPHSLVTVMGCCLWAPSPAHSLYLDHSLFPGFSSLFHIKLLFCWMIRGHFLRCWMNSCCYNLFFPAFISLSTKNSKLERLCVLDRRGGRGERTSLVTDAGEDSTQWSALFHSSVFHADGIRTFPLIYPRGFQSYSAHKMFNLSFSLHL